MAAYYRGTLGCCLALTVITLPSGYAENMRLFGNPLGPKGVREEHSIEGRGAGAFLKNGGLNMLRYSFDFTALDCLLYTPRIARLQHELTRAPRWVLHRLGIELAARGDTRRQYIFDRLYTADGNCSFFGIFGVLLVWPRVVDSCRVQQISRPAAVRVGDGGLLSGAGLLQPV